MTVTPATPRERWGTCCPYDPNCEHSYLDADALTRHMDTPFVDADDPDDDPPYVIEVHRVDRHIIVSGTPKRADAPGEPP